MNSQDRSAHRRWPILVVCLFFPVLFGVSHAGEIFIGGAAIDITPSTPVALSGQMHTRIAKKLATRLQANILALETRNNKKSEEQAIFVSCDLVYIHVDLPNRIRARIRKQIPDFDESKLILSATHTHTAPVLYEGKYQMPDKGVVTPDDYLDLLTDRISEGVVRAWRDRKPGSVGWGLGHAVVAYNRRSVYADGHSKMYGNMQSKDFREMEGPEDHGVEVLFFWDKQEQLMATAVNVACPAQEVEGDSKIHADFWHPVRESLRAKYSPELLVLGWTGAAGDQSPHLRYRRRAEERMRKLRGISRLQEISQRILLGWEEAYAGARQEKHSQLPMAHQTKTIELPIRKVTDTEVSAAKEQVAQLAKKPEMQRRRIWHQEVVDRHRRQQENKTGPYRMELHAIRLGDIAIATNDFELFTQFGIQMKARIVALQTFIIQLAGSGTYVPTPAAARGGGYSAIVESNEVGPEGGQVLVEQTVELVNSLWDNAD